MGRGVSEVVALLIIVVIGIAASIAAYKIISGVLASKAKPEVKVLEASIAGIRVLHEGSPVTVTIGSVSYTASYIYQVDVVLYNAGTRAITGMIYVARDVDPTYSTCALSTCDIFDPVVATRSLTTLPSSLGPNQAARATFTVFSKVDLGSLGRAPFVILVRGSVEGGGYVEAQVAPFG